MGTLGRDDAPYRPEDGQGGDPVDPIRWKALKMVENIGLTDDPDPGFRGLDGGELLAPFSQASLDWVWRWICLEPRAGCSQNGRRDAEGDGPQHRRNPAMT